jgi:hypothetical protein
VLVEHYTGDANWTLRPFEAFNNPSGIWVKPRGALWTSPVGSTHSWRQWCTHNVYHLNELLHVVTIDVDLSRAVVIDSRSDAKEKLPWVCDYAVDFEALVNAGITAIHLTEAGELDNRVGYHSLIMWDCETVCLLTSDIIRAWEFTPAPDEEGNDSPRRSWNAYQAKLPAILTEATG